MKSKKKNIIGFDRKIELEWIDFTAKCVLEGLSESEIRKKLKNMLSIYGLGTSKGGASDKTITVLVRLWLNVSEDVVPLRNMAVDLYKYASKDEKVIIHVCLASANYPFFFDVLTQIGRLLKLQDSFASEQIKRRIVEKWGDTQRVKRSVCHTLQTLKLWGIIVPVKKVNIYRSVKFASPSDKKIKCFIENSLKMASENKCYKQDCLLHPAMFFLRVYN